VCNLYSNTLPQEAMRRLFSAIDRLGNLPTLAAVFPDADVPIVRLGGDGRRELVSARWGWARTDRGWVTNARNLERSWGVLRNVGQRCLVPATAFAEYHPTATIPSVRGRPIKAATWFRLAGTTDRPPFAFPGFWRPWDWRIDGLRRASDRDLAASSAATLAMVFLTCPANGVVRPIHPKAMPVVLHTEAQYETWLTGDAANAAALQRPLPDSELEISFIGAKADEPGPPASPESLF
jgi:putative SOS response-associated peptidase YedK